MTNMYLPKVKVCICKRLQGCNHVQFPKNTSALINSHVGIQESSQEQVLPTNLYN